MTGGNSTRAESSPLLGILLWLALAIIAGTRHFPPESPPLFLPGTVWGLVAIFFLAYRFARPFHDWLLTVDLRVLLAFHLTRYVGIYFLVLYRAQQLPYEFAVLGGWGDIIAADGVALLILFAPRRGRASWLAHVIWNAFGLADILFVALTAARLNLEHPGSMQEIFHLPLSLLPTFVVPIIIATHLIILVRLLAARLRNYERF